MTRLIRRLLALLLTFMLASLAASAAAAVALKGRLLPSGTHRDDDVELVSLLGAGDFTSTAGALRRLRVTSLLGGGTLDLRLATLDPAGATMTIRSAFAGYRVLVPGTWRVEMRVLGIFGGAGDARDRAWVDPGHAVLRIEGLALFGGVGVLSQADDIGPARPPVLPPDWLGDDVPAGNRGLVTDIEQVPPSPASM